MNLKLKNLIKKNLSVMVVFATLAATPLAKGEALSQVALCDLSTNHRSGVAGLQVEILSVMLDSEGSENIKQLISQCQQRAKKQRGRNIELLPDGTAYLYGQRKVPATNTSPARVEEVRHKGSYAIIDGEVAHVFFQLPNGDNIEMIVNEDLDGVFIKRSGAKVVKRFAIVTGK